MNKIEKEFIIEILKYNANEDKIIALINNNSINWVNILGFISYHRIAGLIYEKMNNINIRLLDFPVFFSTYLINQAQQIRNYYQLEEIKNISKNFNRNNIEYIFLKGSILNHTIFNSGTRSSNDIDILIKKDSIDSATKILNNLGYIQGKYDYNNNKINPYNLKELKLSLESRGETSPFVKITNKPTIKTIDVDINFSLDWTPNYNQELINHILKNRIKIKLDEENYIFSASVEDNIIELCIHLYKDMALLDIVKKRKVFDLYKFIDIYYYINSNLNKINFDKLKKEIKLFNAEKYVYFTLRYLLEIFSDFGNKQILSLIEELKVNIKKLDIVDIIFNQYNEKEVFISNCNIIDRIFQYNVINKYTKKDGINEKFNS